MGAAKRPSRAESLLGRVLVVEDCVALCRVLQDTLAPHATSMTCVGTCAAALEALSAPAPDIVLLDYALPDGTAVAVIEAIAALPQAPVVVAMSGSAAPAESFQLASMGVRHFVEKPLDGRTLLAALVHARTTPPALRTHVRQLVGHRGIHEVEDEVRSTMVCEALARAEGSRRGAAQLLSISRQLLQHMLRKTT